VGGVDVEGVGFRVLPEAEGAGAVPLRHRQAGEAAPEDAAGHRGRGVAQGRAVEEELVLEAVVELGRPRLGGIGDMGELGEGLRLQRRWLNQTPDCADVSGRCRRAQWPPSRQRGKAGRVHVAYVAVKGDRLAIAID